MADNKENIGKQDDIRVDSHDPSEVEYLHRQFPLMSHDQILTAIKVAGPLRNDIVEHLRVKKRESKY